MKAKGKNWNKKFTKLITKYRGFVYLDYKLRGNQDKEFKLLNRYNYFTHDIKHKKYFKKTLKLWKERNKKLFSPNIKNK